jgi:hypothetical protein
MATTKRGKKLLVHFVHDVLSNAAVQRRLIQDPDGEMKRHGLTSKQISVLKKGKAFEGPVAKELAKFSSKIRKANPEA